MLTDGLRYAFTPAAMITREHHLPRWFRERFETVEAFARFTALMRLANTWVGLGVFTLFLSTVGWVIAGNGSLLFYGIPVAFAPIAAAIIASLVVRLGAQVPSGAERRAARAQGARVFALGASPATKLYMVVQAAGLTFVEANGADVAIIDWSRIEIAAVKTAKSGLGVGLSLSVDAEWFDIPIVLEAGGPVAPAWSVSPLARTSALADAVAGCFEGRVAVHRPDERVRRNTSSGSVRS